MSETLQTAAPLPYTRPGGDRPPADQPDPSTARTAEEFFRRLKASQPCARQDELGRWLICGACRCAFIEAAYRRFPVNEENVNRDERSHEVDHDFQERSIEDAPTAQVDRVVYQRWLGIAFEEG